MWNKSFVTRTSSSKWVASNFATVAWPPKPMPRKLASVTSSFAPGTKPPSCIAKRGAVGASGMR